MKLARYFITAAFLLALSSAHAQTQRYPFKVAGPEYGPVTHCYNTSGRTPCWRGQAITEIQRYQFHRVVTITDHKKVLTRESEFITLDDGTLRESQIAQTGKLRGVNDKYWRRFPNPVIGTEPIRMDGWTLLWTDERGLEQTKNAPWFAEHDELSGLIFPVLAVALGPRKVEVRYSDYRLFRTSLVIREVGINGPGELGMKWKRNAQVRVFFMPGFSPEQRAAVMIGANRWSRVGGISFTEAGSASIFQLCPECLTIERKESAVKGELAHLTGWPYAGTSDLACAVIEFSNQTQALDALESFAQHEIGHSEGLGHSAHGIMSVFKHGLNRPGPTMTADDVMMARRNYEVSK